MQHHQPKDAALSFRRALQLQPDFPEALAGVGSASAATGDLDAAESAFARLITRGPTMLARDFANASA